MTIPTPQTLPGISDEQIAMLKRDIYDISSGEFYATAEEAQLIVEAVLAITAQPQVAVPAIPEGRIDLTRLYAAARVHASIAASPHHMTFTVEALRNLIEELAAPRPPAGQQDRGEEPKYQAHPHSFSCEKTINGEQTCDRWCGNKYRCITTMTYAQILLQEAYEHGHRDALNAVEEKLAHMAQSTSPHRRVAAKDLYDGLQTIKPTAAVRTATSEATAAQQDGWRRGMEDAAKEADHWQTLSDKGGKCKCGTYIAGAIRAIAAAAPANGEGAG